MNEGRESIVLRSASLLSAGWRRGRRLLPLAVIAMLYAAEAQAASCLYVSSYHKGYEWNDGIERGIEAGLKGHCELSRFYMDTNRHTDTDFARRKAVEARDLIDRTRPDVVIACDDAASMYLVKAYFKDAPQPIVFCGVNGSVDAYGYPYTNVTGMIEIAPIKPLMKEVRGLVSELKSGVYLAADVITQRKEFEENRDAYALGGIKLAAVFVKTMDEWSTAFAAAQNTDFVVLGTNAGIADWDGARARQAVRAGTRKLTVTNYDWMAPFAVLAMTKVAEEQGEWSAHLARTILGGVSPGTLPIVVNRRWQTYVNPTLADKAGIQLPPRLVHRALKADRP
ncbi:MAG: ABC transporter substrate binding protein [Burkholderiaceae bacterium]